MLLIRLFYPYEQSDEPLEGAIEQECSDDSCVIHFRIDLDLPWTYLDECRGL